MFAPGFGPIKSERANAVVIHFAPDERRRGSRSHRLNDGHFPAKSKSHASRRPIARGEPRCYNLTDSRGFHLCLTMVGRILQPEIKSLIDARNFTALRELFSEMPPVDVAEIILDLPEDEQVIIFRILPHGLAADVFEYLDVDVEAQQQLLRGDGARAGGGDPERDVAGRSHGAARGNAERGGAAVDPAAHAGGAARRPSAARLSRGQRRPVDDA